MLFTALQGRSIILNSFFVVRVRRSSSRRLELSSKIETNWREVKKNSWSDDGDNTDAAEDEDHRCKVIRYCKVHTLLIDNK